MKLRAEPISRLANGLVGLGLVCLAYEWMRVALESTDAFWLEEIPRTEPVSLVVASSVAVLLAAFGGRWAVGAVMLGVTCTDEVVTLHGLFRTRRIPTNRITGVRRGAMGGVYLQWKDSKGWPQSTKIVAFSISPFARRRVPMWVTGHNEPRITALEDWIKQHAGAR